MIEVWEESRENPRYAVSSFGRIYDQDRDRFLSQSSDRAGYLRVKLWIHGVRETRSVHRFIVASFFEADISEFEVNHIDGDKTNNHIWNLELCDRHENMMHAFANGLARPVYAPRRVRIVETGEVFASTGQVDRYLGVSSGSVSKTIRGIQTTCKGYTFAYVS